MVGAAVMLKRYAMRFIASIAFASINLLIQCSLWLFIIIGIGWEQCGIGMGLGGAVYPALFAIPLVVLSILLSFSVLCLHDLSRVKKRYVHLSFIAVSSLFILLACPMDSQHSFLVELFRCVF